MAATAKRFGEQLAEEDGVAAACNELESVLAG